MLPVAEAFLTHYFIALRAVKNLSHWHVLIALHTRVQAGHKIFVTGGAKPFVLIYCTRQAQVDMAAGAPFVGSSYL